MDIQDWFTAQPTLVQAGLTLLAVVAAVALLFVGSATVGSVFFGGEDGAPVVAEAEVNFDTGGDAVTVTFVSAESSDTHLEVRVREVTDGGGQPYQGQSSATLTDEGDQNRFSGTGMEDGDEFQVSVVAVNGDRRTTIATETATL